MRNILLKNPVINGVTNGDLHDHLGGDGSPITEGAINLADVLTGDVSITKHGFCPKAPNDATKYLRGDATWAIASGFTQNRIKSSIANQNIPSVSDYTWSIALGVSGYTHGTVLLRVPFSVSNAFNRRGIGYYKFSTVLNEASGFGPSVSQYVVSLSVFNDRWQSGYAYSIDASLSDYFYSANVASVRLTSIQINGSNLDLIFRNISGFSGTLTLEAVIDVWRL